MEGYNINEIEVIDKDKPSLEELLTGDVIKGLPAHSPVQPNSELEIGEYLQFPDGKVQRVVGRKHEKGGVKMHIPDGTKIISDSLQPTKEQAKMLSEKYKIDVTTKDNFADIIDKYSKKIGLDKLNNEQELQFTELKKVLDSKAETKTLEINRAYLSKKINDLEKQKESKEKERKEFFDKVFDIQENNKPDEEKYGSEEGFKKGGISQKNFEAVCKKHGITPDQGMKILKLGGYYRKFEDGGKYEKLFKGDKNLIRQYEYIENISNNPNFVDALYEKYEKAWDNKDVQSKGYYGVRGQGKYDKLSKKQVVQNFKDSQKRNLALKAHGIDYSKVGNSPTKGKNTTDYLIRFISENGLDKEGIEIPGADKTAQEQLSYIAFNDLVTDFNTDNSSYSDIEELKVFKAKPAGINDEKWGSGNISLADGVYTNTTAGHNTEMDWSKVEDKKEDKVEDEEEEDETTPKGTDVKENVIPPKKNYARYFMSPDQSVLPPSPMEAHLKTDIRLGRINPVKLGIENQEQALANQFQFGVEQAENLPPALRASMLSNMLASQQRASNEAIFQTNLANAQNQAQADLFNTKQADQESIYAAQNALNYEQRQLLAKAKTEAELRNYYDFNRAVRIQDYKDRQQFAGLMGLYPELNVGPSGEIVFDPSRDWTVDEQNAIRQSFLNNRQT